MRVSDVDIEIIYKLLQSVPQGMQIKSIDLTNGYSLNLVAGTEEINALEKEAALSELQNIINQYKQFDQSKKLKSSSSILIK